jgi:hypothetical protein
LERIESAYIYELWATLKDDTTIKLQTEKCVKCFS